MLPSPNPTAPCPRTLTDTSVPFGRDACGRPGAFGVAVRARSLQRVVPAPVPIADSALIEELDGVMSSPRLPPPLGE